MQRRAGASDRLGSKRTRRPRRVHFERENRTVRGQGPPTPTTLARVVEPGGRVVFLELNRPPTWGFRHLFDWYFHSLSPLVGGLIARDRAAYEYLPRSVDNFEAVEDIRDLMAAAGLAEVRVHRLTFGVAVVHVGTVPPAP